MKILNPIVSIFTKKSLISKESNFSWREQIFSTIFISMLVIGFFVYVLTSLYSLKSHDWNLLVATNVVYFFNICIVLTKVIPFRIRSACGMLIFFSLGCFLLYNVGPLNTTFLWFLVFTFLTGILLGTRYSLAAIFMSFLAFVAAGFLYNYNLVNWQYITEYSIYRYIIVTANVIFLESIVTIPLAILIKELEQTLVKERSANETLKKEQDLLVKTNKNLKAEIKARHSVTRELGEERDRNQLYLDIAGTILVSMKQDFSITMLNKMGHKVFAYPKGALIGMNWIDTCLTPNERDSIKAYLQDIMDNMSYDTNYREIPIVQKNGETREVVWNFTVLKNEHGEVSGLLGSGMDITERKQAEKALQKSEATLRSVFEATPIGIGLISSKRILIWANEQFTSITGYTNEEVMGQSARILYANDEEFERVGREKHPLVRKYGIGAIEAKLQRKDGKIIDALISSALIDKNDFEAGMVFTINDITERKRAVEEIRKFKTISDQANYATVIADLNQNIIYANEHCARMHGYDNTDAMIGKSILDFIPSEDMSKFEQMLQEVAASGGFENVESALLSISGDRIPVLVNATLIRDEKNNPLFFAASAIDLTEKKKAEEYRQRLQEKLEKAQRMESLGILAGGVAHDLNNMLGPLVGYPELMLRKLPEDSPVRKHVISIGKSALDAADVIQDLLSLARRGRYEMALTDINEVIEASLNSTNFDRIKETNPGVELKTNLDKNVTGINGSFTHLNKAIMNLIANAYDAMPEGGELTIETSLQYLNELLSGQKKINAGDYVLIRVKDTGMGINPEDLDKIFEPYYSKKIMGTSGSGLGLAVVYGIIKDHHGFYDIFTSEDQGTEFVMYFPTAPRTTSEHPNTAEGMNLEGTEKILVVDDVEVQRVLATEILKSFGYRVETVASGREAISFLKEHEVDLVMLDMIMEKDFDGLDTYREIIKIRPGQKVVIVSGFSATERVEKLQELSNCQYIRKPYTRDAIGRAVKCTLTSKTSQST